MLVSDNAVQEEEDHVEHVVAAARRVPRVVLEDEAEVRRVDLRLVQQQVVLLLQV